MRTRTRMMDIGQTLKEIERLRGDNERLYSNINRFTVQVILTHLHNSPMSVTEIHSLQQHITSDITERQVIGLLDDLVDLGYAKKIGIREYKHTQTSTDVLEREGITKQLFR